MGLIDTHCHLTYGALAEDPHGAWQRAREAGVDAALVVAIDVESAPTVLDFVSQYEELYAAVGIHPNEVGKARPGDMQRIAELAEHPKVIAIGETGLDTYWDKAPVELQQTFMDRHVELAMKRDLPLILHLRDTYLLAAQTLETHAGAGLNGVIHCFAGEADEADPFIEWGWPISFSGIITYPKAENVREAAQRTPLEQCLVETDAPWLTPRGYGKEANEPAFVVETARKLAQVKGISEEVLSCASSANGRRFLAIA